MNRAPQDVEFKAGKAKLTGTTVTSDSRKGYLKFGVTPEGLTCVQWRPRDSSAYEDEFYFAPGELKFVKVAACTTGRMYYLNFSDSNQKEFYWLQEANADGDAKIEKAIKVIESYIPDDDEDEQMAVDTPPTTIKQEQHKNPSINEVSQSQPKPTTTTTPPPSATNLDFIKDLFSNLPTQPKQSQITLGKILTAENLIPFLRANPDIKKELVQYLPEEYQKDENMINEVLHSAQFLQSIETLDYAIHEGHGPEIVSLLGYEPSIASQRGVEGFLTNIQEGSNKKKNNK
ncbi:hypothetical protein RB653_010448 [Dictyostelium firmibasis]|uniref:Proteasomal ubiquitin receptor ADRM1 homolog n=1 Tax=Dictyostelium firmibasis TaxID=79012 RepID=A0AAN7TK27_9MYCE